VQGEISTPIQDLAERARRVSRDHDYSPYALEEREDELGELLTAFDGLVSGIRERDDALRRSERHFRSLIENGSDLVMVLGGEGVIRYVSPSVCRLVGRGADELEGHPWEDLVHPEDAPGVRALLEALKARADASRTAEFRVRHHDGSWPVLEAITVNRLADPAVDGIVVNARDISERKRVERELKQAKEAAESVDRAKSRFLASINHEIRTPMTAVLAMTELLELSELSVAQARYVDIARNSGNQLLHVIDDILELSWVDSGQLSLDSLEFDLYVLVEQVLDLFAQRAHAKNVELCSLIEAEVPRYLHGDPRRLRQVLINLVGNAVKFTDHGEVHVHVATVSTDDDQRSTMLRFTITDSGIGVPEALRGQLFAPFVQGDYSPTRRHGGAGVGLAVSRSLVDLMGGEIGLDSLDTGGSSFWFTAGLERAKAPSPSPPRPDGSWAGRRALVVDDNPVARDYLARQLAQLELRVDQAEDGRTALTELRGASADGDDYDLVFVDYAMSGMDGAAVVRAVRADHHLRDVRLTVMTSLNDNVSREALGWLVFDAQLAKPVKQSELQALVESAWSDPHPFPSAQATVPRALYIRPRPGKPRSEPRILLAEDEPTVRESLTLLLSSMGCAVDTVSNGAEALAATHETTYDLILMDCQMPEVDGYQATREIRVAEGGNRHVPIVGMSGYLLEGDRDRCLSAGMDDYLIKPIPMAMLEAVLERRLRT
jgi:PAS domain S-box-containing protein